MPGIDDILDSLPIDQIAQKLGVDPAVARQAVQEGGGAILNGLQKNARSPEGSAAIQKALGQHTGMGSTVDIDRVDTADGEKILKHVFGDNERQVAQRLTDEPKTAGIDFAALLPLLAPIVMGLLAKGQQGQQGQAPAGQQGGGVGDLIGGLLGGGAPSSSAGGVDIGGLLGGLLGNGK